MNKIIHPTVKSLLPFLLAIGSCISQAKAGVNIDIRAEDSINDTNTAMSYGAVLYNTAQGLTDTRTDNGATISYAPDGQAGHYYFSASANATGGSNATGSANEGMGVYSAYAIAGAPLGGRDRQAFSTSQINDTVTFTNFSSQPVPITVHWHLDGTLNPGPGLNANAYHQSLFSFIGSGGLGGAVHSDGLRHQDPSNNSETWSQSGWDQNGGSYQVVPSSGGRSGITFTGHIMLPPGPLTFGLNTVVSIAARGPTSVANFTNPAGASFELPNSVAYTSASGMLFSHGRRGDFNRDSFPDYVLFDPANHRTSIWYLQANTLHNTAFGPILPAGWIVACVADMNMDGKADYVLVNSSTHQTAIWYLNNNALAITKAGPTLPAGWSLAAAADFNNDASPDYVLYNAASRRTVIWYLHGNTFAGSVSAPILPAGWTLLDVNDFNNDNKPDLVIFYANTRRVAFWYLNGVTFAGSANGPLLPSGWMLQGTTDFNRDGKPDLALLNTSTHRTAHWYLKNGAVTGTVLGPTITAGSDLVAP
jgi:hypothetical protein